jgi:Heparinase II/III-like protein/Heparinase II/III N-terminus
MNLRRLPQMNVAEVAGRTRQEVSKWWDRMAASSARRRRAGSAPDSERQLESFRVGVPGRFFAGAAEEGTPALLAERLPNLLREVIVRAEQALDGHFDLLGYRGLSFGDPVDWRFDPISRRRSPLVHWSCLDPLDSATGGDSKVVWELNRHQWLADLGQAYRMTGDERYGRALAAYVTGWLESNPVGVGINWASSLEVALRLMAWCWALVLFRRSPALTPELFARMSASVEEHAGHIEKYLSYYFSPNTHLTGEALGLFYAGTVFPELSGARRWRERGARILIEESRRQVRPDGVYFEQSTCYQRYTVEIALHFLILCARNGVSVPAVVGERLQGMLDFLLAVRFPRGEAPTIGDSDGGWLLPLARRAPGDLRGVFGAAAALFGRGDYAWAAGGVGPELLWLLGRAGLTAFESLRPAPPATGPSRLFADGGYAVMRDGWGEDGHHLVFDVGPLGCPSSGGHGHADLLSIQCAAFGEAFLVDPGTGSYADQAWRSFFRSSAAHSTVMVDGQSQAVPGGAFAWRQRPRARLNRWLSAESFDFADAEHDAYERLPDPVRHRRRVLFVKPRYWVLVDDLEGAAEHRVELRFQFGPVDVSLEPGSWARATAGQRSLLVRAFAGAPLQERCSQGRQDPMEGWISPDYGQRHPAPTIVYSITARLPLRIVTLLLPSADAGMPPPAVRPRRGGPGEITGLVFEATDETVSIDANRVWVHSSSVDPSS